MPCPAQGSSNSPGKHPCWNSFRKLQENKENMDLPRPQCKPPSDQSRGQAVIPARHALPCVQALSYPTAFRMLTVPNLDDVTLNWTTKSSGQHLALARTATSEGSIPRNQRASRIANQKGLGLCPSLANEAPNLLAARISWKLMWGPNFDANRFDRYIGNRVAVGEGRAA